MWRCKKCGGIFRGVKRVESLSEHYLYENGKLGELLDSHEKDTDFSHYECKGCGEKAYNLDDLRNMGTWNENNKS